MIEWKKLMWFFFDTYLFLLPVGYHGTLLQLCGHSIFGKVTIKSVVIVFTPKIESSNYYSQ